MSRPLEDFRDLLVEQGVLVEVPPISTPPPEDVVPEDVTVRRVDTEHMVRLQAGMSRAVWRPAPGRKLGFRIEMNDSLLGIVFLSSTVINLKVRDDFLGLPADAAEKGRALRHYANLAVCVAAQPFGWYWNGGKMLAAIATTLGDYWVEAYGDEMRGIVTTSLWGKGSQYNRIYRFLGYTVGFGHEHVDERDYQAMVAWLRCNNRPVPGTRFGDGSNSRMARIAAYGRESGDAETTLQHGHIRGVYYHDSVDAAERTNVIAAWRGRWGRPRFERVRDQAPPYVYGNTSA